MQKNKVILLNFPPSLGFSYVSKGAIYPHAAIMLIGSILKKNGYNATIVDGAYDENYIEVLKGVINKGDVLYVGMSVMTTQVPFALEASKVVKKHNKDLPVVWGGVHPTLFPAQTLCNENVDIAVINEGSFAALDLAGYFKSGGDLRGINGIGFKDKDNKVCITDCRELEDITQLPHFDFSLVNVENYLSHGADSVYRREFPLSKERIRIMPILTGLGCAYKCEFCINVILKRRYRFLPAELIVKEIKRLQESYGADTFLFLDEDFFINKKRILEFISLVEKERLQFNWRAWCRVDHFKDDFINAELLKRLSNIGYVSMAMGAESANPEILKNIKKDITVEQIRHSLKLISNTDIFPRYSFMVGLENETMKQIKNTYRLCLDMKKMNPRVDIAGPFVFRLYPGSPIYNRLVSKYDLNMPVSLESWTSYLEKQNTYTELPWVPKRFKKNLKWITYYSDMVFGNNCKRIQGIREFLRHVIFFVFPKIRLRYFCFCFPFEYGLQYGFKKNRGV